MKRLLLSLALGASGLLYAGAALPCGGPFGQDYTIRAQSIVVKYTGGKETYVFRPDFCGKASEFGLILPVPAQLSSQPVLTGPTLFDELDALAKPTTVYKKTCSPPGMDGGAGGTDNGGPPGRGGVTVVDKGRVGMFDWSLLKADNVTSFTAWLDANKFTYTDGDKTIFDYYVKQSWYFVAFKVTADASDAGALGPNQQLCGQLGPIALEFPIAQPVVPARIAAVGSDRPGYVPQASTWRVFAIGDQVLGANTTGVSETRHFSGGLTAASLGAAPEVAKLASAGLKLAKLDVSFDARAIPTDLVLRVSSNQADYRETETVWEYDPSLCPAADAGPDTSTPTPAPNPSSTHDVPTSPAPSASASATPPPGSSVSSGGGNCSTSPGFAASGAFGAFAVAACLASALAFAARRRRK